MSFFKKIIFIFRKIFPDILICILLGLLYFIIDFYLHYDTNTQTIVHYHSGRGRWSSHICNSYYTYDKPITWLIFILGVALLFCTMITWDDIINEYKKLNKISENITLYCDEFVSKFQDALEYIPTTFEIKEFLKPIDKNINFDLVNNILLPIIKQKITIIKNMSILEKYELFYKRNIIGVNLWDISDCNLSKNEINKLLNYINNLTKYIKIRIYFPTNTSINLLNNEISNNKNQSNLIMIFNQKYILKDIILDIFLNNSEDNKLILDDIIHQLNNNIDDKKVKLLIDIIAENIINHDKFKQKFISIFKENVKILNIINDKINQDSK